MECARHGERTYLLDELEDELHRRLELLFINRMRADRQVADH